ncbi:MAG: HAMP domain-containing histidine kinase [Ruminococcus sp.]|nr:HAMP domain-containing histidine kinase [Ruminococcus sp.]
MEKKYKKQKRNIVIRITAVLFAVWLIVSIVFSAITLTAEKQKQITDSHNDYTYLVDSITSVEGFSYNEMCKYVNIVKEHYVDIVKGDIEEEEIKCGADTGNFDKDLQITMYRCAFAGETEEDMQDQLIMDTDKEIFFSFYQDNYIEYDGESGILNYDEFVSSITQEQLDTIKEYLSKEKDEDGYFYLLVNKECYYNPENGHVYPKTVDIAKVYEDSFGYAVSETVETFELTPENTQNLTLYSLPQNEPKIIDGEFVFNEFSSGGLIEDPFERLNLEYYDPETGIIENNGLFTFTINESGMYYIKTLGFDGSEYAIAYRTAVDESLEQAVIVGNDEEYGTIYNAPQPTVEYLLFDIGLRYAKRVNLLECCGDTLIIGITALFAFFLIIGFILTIMMCKVIKTQLKGEQKRVEVTNALAHDIKTPLFIISGYAQNLKEDVNSEKREHYCDRIIERTDEVNSLVHKMLDFSKLDSENSDLKFEDFDVTSKINELIKSFEDTDNHKRFKVKKNASCVVSANKELLSRALLNLIDNAVRYSVEKSDIVIDINEKSLSIKNECSNITQEDVKHLTEPYYRVEKNRESKGSGLGLSIVKSILDIHGYKLNIELSDNTIIFTISFK